MKNLIMLTILMLVINLHSYAQVPQKISYQGMLTTSSGTPVQDGNYDLKFSIYNHPSTGDLKHEQTISSVKVKKGTFSVILNPPSSIFSESLFVEVTVQSGPEITFPVTFSPRTVLTTAPYAFRADTANFAKINLGGWNLTGNAGTVAGTNFIGTTDNQSLDVRTNNVLRARITTKGQIETYNTGKSVFIGEGAGTNDILTNNNNVFIGYWAGYSNTTGHGNTANGYQAFFSNTAGYYNTASGYGALGLNTTGDANTAYGVYALYSNTVGNNNVACGYNALRTNVSGSGAVAIGAGAMQYANPTTTPFTNYNVAVGCEALRGSTTPTNNTGNFNTAIGYYALSNNTAGRNNSAIGCWALSSNTTGENNTANGRGALYNNTTGESNTANGCNALLYNTTGIENTAIGTAALYNITAQSENVAVGSNAGGYYTFSQSTFLGKDAYANASGYTNCMGLGYNARPTGNNRVHIGNASITWIGGQVNWSTYSDARYKRNIREDVKGLDFIMRLRPVTYNVAASEIASFLKEDQKRDKDGNVIFETNEIDRKAREEKEKIRYTGFIAQEVEQAAKEAGFEFSGVDVPKDENGLYSLSYAEFVVPLVKAVQEQQKIIEELKKEIEDLKKR